MLFSMRFQKLRKPIKGSFKPKNQISTSRPLQLDLFEPISTSSLGGSKYAFVSVDDYSRYTWTYFLTHKSECLRYFTKFCKLVQNEKGSMISSIRSDHGGEFQNRDFVNPMDTTIISLFQEILNKMK